MLRSKDKAAIATKTSMIIGMILKKVAFRRVVMEEVPLSITLKTSPVFTQAAIRARVVGDA